MRRFVSVILPLLACLYSFAALPRHAHWTYQVDSLSPESGVLKFTVDIDEGYHIYGSEMPPVISGMPTNPTTITIQDFPGLELGELSASSEPEKHFDSNLNDSLPFWFGRVDFSLPFALAPGTPGAVFDGVIHYMSCDAHGCTPPEDINFNLTFGAPVINTAETAQSETILQASQYNREWWSPSDVLNIKESRSWLGLLWIGFLAGLVALVTPCVWPLIPMTVSFFLKTSKNRRKAIRNAATYSLSIIVIFIALGLLVSLVFGGEALNDLATSAVFNIIFFLLLVVFAISFMGAFEIKLPAKWSNAIDRKAETSSGVVSIFFMAFTLVLVSFSCTGPIVGTLICEVASKQSFIDPLVGMLGFSLGLALPFGLFAIFPSFLKSMPKSGGWMNSVKVVLGFIELILSFKFLSVADLAYGWGILDREVFVSIWIVLFVLLGMYLIGKLRFAHDDVKPHTSILGFFLAVVSFSFAVYLLPGLWGAPLKSISAFAPPISTQDFNLYGGEYEVYDDYDAGMAAAKEQGKPVFVDFTGYGCVNCREMEAAVFDTNDVRDIIEENYVFIRLYVDDRASLPAPFTVEDDGELLTLRTVGEKWSYLQNHKFGILSQPYYVLLDNNGTPLNNPRAYDKDLGKFIEWLNEGLSVYSK